MNNSFPGLLSGLSPPSPLYEDVPCWQDDPFHFEASQTERVPSPIARPAEELTAADPGKGSRTYCFTWNNPPADWKNVLETKFNFGKPKIKYLLAGFEYGLAGTPHLQGYVSFQSFTSFDAARKYLGNSHLEVPYKCFDANYKYCTKDGVYQEWGSRPSTKQSSFKRKAREEEKENEEDKWRHIIQLATLGQWNDIAEQYPVEYGQRYAQIEKLYYAGLKNRVIEQLPMDTKHTGVWYYGSTGTGKSHSARVDYPGIYPKPNNKWWDGYRMEDYVLIEDLGKTHAHWMGDKLKEWVDLYPFIAEVKGGAIKIRPKLFVITSNYLPKDLWEDQAILGPLMRRFKIVHFKKLVECYQPLDESDWEFRDAYEKI